MAAPSAIVSATVCPFASNATSVGHPLGDRTVFARRAAEWIHVFELGRPSQKTRYAASCDSPMAICRLRQLLVFESNSAVVRDGLDAGRGVWTPCAERIADPRLAGPCPSARAGCSTSSSAPVRTWTAPSGTFGAWSGTFGACSGSFPCGPSREFRRKTRGREVPELARSSPPSEFGARRSFPSPRRRLRSAREAQRTQILEKSSPTTAVTRRGDGSTSRQSTATRARRIISGWLPGSRFTSTWRCRRISRACVCPRVSTAASKRCSTSRTKGTR